MSLMLPSMLTVEEKWSMSSPLAKMSRGDVDVESFLVSRNTLGNDEPQLKSQNHSVKIESEFFAVELWWLRKTMVVMGYWSA